MCARMIPGLGPAEHDDRSQEGEIYYALSRLPEDFTVIHSYKILEVVDERSIEQKEADFVVFNRKPRRERSAASMGNGSMRAAGP